jgi:hypothetical protein
MEPGREQPEVRRAMPSQLETLAMTLARAFAGDPMFRWPLPPGLADPAGPAGLVPALGRGEHRARPGLRDRRGDPVPATPAAR